MGPARDDTENYSVLEQLDSVDGRHATYINSLCPVTSCIFTPDQSLFNQSDVVLYFDNHETFDRLLLHYRQPDQMFVFVVDTFQPRNQSNRFNSMVGNNRTRFNFFNRTMAYRRDSDVILRHSLLAP